MQDWSIRLYNGKVSDVRGIMTVEIETFHECPYAEGELLARLGAPDQRVWVAEADGEVAGFLCGLRLHTIRGPHLEADLLAVRPRWQGRGVASALLAGLRGASGDVVALRSVVRPDNLASQRAFARAGFAPAGPVCDLVVYRILGCVPRLLPAWGGAIRPLADLAEAAQLAHLVPGTLPDGAAIWAASQQPGPTLLVAVADGIVVGGAELVEAHTLLYSGLWVESLQASPANGHALPALIAAAVELGKARGLDSVSCLVPQEQRALLGVFRAEGFALVDPYRAWFAVPVLSGKSC